MLIQKDIPLRDFEFWSGAESVVKKLDSDDLDKIESSLEELYNCGEKPMDETELNDLFWHDSDSIAQLLGYDDWEDLVAKKAEEDEEDEVATGKHVYNMGNGRYMAG